MNVAEAIKNAESVLPGKEAPENAIDPRWQAIIAIAEFIQNEPEAVWSFVKRWGQHPDEDLRQAIATCLLEHLLEHHWDTIFPQVERMARENRLFATTVGMCWHFGQAEQPKKSAEMKRLVQESSKAT